MAGETTITIIGNLTDRPDLRVTQNGTSMCRFTVASTPRTFDKASGGWRDGEALFLTCTAWRELAEHAFESLDKGARVIVVGRLRLSKWETPEGEKRSMMQLDVDEVGPSLRFATVKVNKLNRSNATPAPADEWSTATPTRPAAPATADDPFATSGATTGATAGARGGAGFDDEPPF